MTVVLSERADLTLEAFRRVARQREGTRLSREALELIEASRTAFMALIEDGSSFVYGVTSGFGDRARLQLTPEERAQQAREASDRGVSFGEALPERVARGIVFARLANIVGGHAAIRPQLADAVAGLLDGATLPAVPSQGNGGSGEIIALGHLFRPLTNTFELAPKEGLALINGSPCAAALVADAALSAERRLAEKRGIAATVAARAHLGSGGAAARRSGRRRHRRRERVGLGIARDALMRNGAQLILRG